MSDYIPNNQNHAMFFNSVYGSNNCPSYDRYSGQFNKKVSLFDKDVGFDVQENPVNQSEGIKCYQQRKTVGADSARSDRDRRSSECIDISSVGELQRLSSILIQLLSVSKQKTLKKDASPLRLFPQADKTTSLTNEVSGNALSAQNSDTLRKEALKEKERRKKDSHNKIEKRRRSFISNRITELGNLLPENIDRATCRKKSSILKESIDYIKELRKDLDRVHRLEDKMSETYFEVKKLTLRLKQLETRMTTKVPNNGGIGHLQDKTSEGTNINTSLTELPYTDKQYSAPTSKERRSDRMTTRSEFLGLDEVGDDLSSTLTVDPTVSLPGNAEMDIGDMDCYL